MKRYVLQANEGQVLLQAGEAAVPEPGPGQLLVKVQAAGLNRGEFIPGGLVKGGAAKPAGLEAAGEVAALGPGVQGWALGQAVMGRCAGAFAEYALMDLREAMPRPATLPVQAAAALPLTQLVAYDMLVLQGHLQAGQSPEGQAQPGRWLLVTGVASGVGVASLQLAKALGAQVVGTSGSADKLARLNAAGLDLGLHTRAPDFAPAVLQATGGAGVNLVVNTVGGTLFAECLRCMAFEGRLATVGYVDNTLQAPLDLQALHAKRLTLFGVSNKLRSADQRAAALPAFKAQVLPLVAAGRLTPLVDRVFAFDDLPAARACMESGQHLGKIVLVM